jgi:hypothetical protein
MDQILAFIASHWTEWLFTIALALLSYFLKILREQLAEERRKNEAIAEGVQSLLRDSIVTGYGKYSDRGYCPIYAKESLKKIYQAYHKLGGNDVATELYQKCLKMPEEKRRDEDD